MITLLLTLLTVTPAPGQPVTLIFKQGSTVLGRVNSISCGSGLTCTFTAKSGVGTVSK